MKKLCIKNRMTQPEPKPLKIQPPKKDPMVTHPRKIHRGEAPEYLPRGEAPGYITSRSSILWRYSPSQTCHKIMTNSFMQRKALSKSGNPQYSFRNNHPFYNNTISLQNHLTSIHPRRNFGQINLRIVSPFQCKISGCNNRCIQYFRIS